MRLKYPYKTKYINYADLGFEDRCDAIDKSSLELSIKLINTSCCGSSVPFDYPFLNQNAFNENEWMNIRDVFLNIATRFI